MGICCPSRKARGIVGRPRDPSKEDAILAAARESFLEKGVAASTIEDIAQRAGVSKVTVYNRFGDKESLFVHVIGCESGKMAEALDDGSDGDRSLEERLNAFGATLLGFMFDPDHVAFDRVVMHDLSQNPKLASRFFAAGPAQCRSRLSCELARADRDGGIAIDDPDRAAEDLTALWRGFADVELKFGVIRKVDEAEIKARVARGTRLFLRAHRPREEEVKA